jgi:hypothetical protein
VRFCFLRSLREPILRRLWVEREGSSDSETVFEGVLLVALWAVDVILLLLLLRIIRGMETERWPELALLPVVDTAREALRSLRGDEFCAAGGRLVVEE